MREEKEKTIYKMNHKWNYQPPSQEQTEVLLKSVGCAAILPIQLYTAADAKCHHITAAELGA